MTTAEAHARIDAASAEVYRLRIARWAVEWPTGHREMDAHKPQPPAKKKPPEGLGANQSENSG